MYFLSESYPPLGVNNLKLIALIALIAKALIAFVTPGKESCLRRLYVLSERLWIVDEGFHSYCLIQFSTPVF